MRIRTTRQARKIRGLLHEGATLRFLNVNPVDIYQRGVYRDYWQYSVAMRGYWREERKYG